MKLGNYKDNDVELCRTTNSRVSTHTAEALLEQHIPFTKNSKKIPFFKRETYQGADTLWVITINPRRYGQARRHDNHRYVGGVSRHEILLLPDGSGTDIAGIFDIGRP